MFKTSFGERVFRIYAAVMRTLFPTYCVKSLTKRYNEGRKNNKAELFLPGVEKELEAIKKLQLDAEGLKAREWSYETRLELLRLKEYALVSRINSEKEVNLLVNGIHPTDIVVEAFKVYTPSKKYLLEFLNHEDCSKLFAVISGIPSAFDSLTPWEILGVEEKKAYEGKNRWAVAEALAKSKPSWAPKFITEVMKIVPSRLNEEALAALSCFVNVAIENKVDISNSIAYLMVIHKDLYVRLRIALAKDAGEHKLEPYVRALFPQFVGQLSNDFGTIYAKHGPSSWAREEMKLPDDHEAAVWLYFALRPATIDLVIDSLSEIKSRVSEKAFLSVEDDVFTFSTGARDILALMNIYKDDANKQEELREKLLKTASSTALCKFYPFKGWSAEQAEKAVRALAIGKKLPDDLSGLSEKLQAVALEELEIQSECEIISRGTPPYKEELVKQRLHPRSEVALVCHYYGDAQTYAEAYVKNFKMAEDSFKEMVSRTRDSKGYDITSYIRAIIMLYAEKWGLSSKNYRDLMQSEAYSDLGTLLKKYYHEGSRQPSFEDGV